MPLGSTLTPAPAGRWKDGGNWTLTPLGSGKKRGSSKKLLRRAAGGGGGAGERGHGSPQAGGSLSSEASESVTIRQLHPLYPHLASPPQPSPASACLQEPCSWPTQRPAHPATGGSPSQSQHRELSRWEVALWSVSRGTGAPGTRGAVLPELLCWLGARSAAGEGGQSGTAECCQQHAGGPGRGGHAVPQLLLFPAVQGQGRSSEESREDSRKVLAGGHSGSSKAEPKEREENG